MSGEVKTFSGYAGAVARGTEELALYGALTAGALAVGALFPGVVARRNEARDYDTNVRRASLERDLTNFSMRWLTGIGIGSEPDTHTEIKTAEQERELASVH